VVPGKAPIAHLGWAQLPNVMVVLWAEVSTHLSASNHYAVLDPASGTVMTESYGLARIDRGHDEPGCPHVGQEG